MKLKKVFFSYSRADADFALKLALDLKKEGFDVWIDQEDIRAGSEWDLEIEKALATCDCLLFIQSEKSVASTNVLDEVYYALEQNKTVIPILIDNCKTPFRINRLQRISFIDNYETGLTNLKDNLHTGSMPDLKYADVNKTNRLANIFRVKYLFLALLGVLVLITVIYFTKTKPQPAKAVEETLNMIETFVGEWALKDMEPKTPQKKGYLKIEDIGEGKVKITSSLQFYYSKTNDTAFFNVFNAFAECASCILKSEMFITDKQIDVGAQKYIILKENRPGVGKAGDTTLNAGLNTAVRASFVLNLINRDSALVTIHHTDSTAASYGIVIPPFEYSFSFKKEL